MIINFIKRILGFGKKQVEPEPKPEILPEIKIQTSPDFKSKPDMTDNLKYYRVKVIDIYQVRTKNSPIAKLTYTKGTWQKRVITAKKIKGRE